MNAWEEVLLERQDAAAEAEKKDRQRINALNARLLNMNRMDDVLKAATNLAYQEKLLKEFGL